MTAVGSLPPGTKGIDCNTRINAHEADALYSAGYRFVVRYVRREDAHSYDLSTAEIATLHAAGLGVMPVQHVADPHWLPSAALGVEYGRVAAFEAQRIGVPKGVTLWCDLEEVSKEATPADVTAYCNAWHDQVKLAGYDPGLYVGYRPGLNSVELYRDLKFTRYWRAYNGDVTPVTRGFCMKQSAFPAPEDRVQDCPFEYDENVITPDALGGSPTLLLPDSLPAVARAA